MRKPLYIYFSGKNEYVINKNLTEEKPIGSLLISFIDFDFLELKNSVEAIKTVVYNMPDEENSVLSADNPDEKMYFLFAKVYQEKYKELENAHPLLADIIDYKLKETIERIHEAEFPMAYDYAYRIIKYFPNEKMTPRMINAFADSSFNGIIVYDEPLKKVTKTFIDEFLLLIDELIEFKADLIEMIENSLDIDTAPQDTSSLERFFIMQNDKFEIYVKNKELIDNIRIENRILKDNENLSPYSFYTSNDIRALIMVEFEYMCINNYYLKKCENCNRYFQPFSISTRYCDRAVSEIGKSCKKVASVVKSKENTSEAKQIYNKINNRNQMRYVRMPNGNKKGLKLWRESAKEVLTILERDGMTIDEFERIISDDYKSIKAWLNSYNN